MHPILPFERWARAVWPLKPVERLRDLTARSPRTCKYQLAGAREPGYTDVAAILRSEDGFSFLQHLLGDARPSWWRAIERARSLASMRKQLEEQRRRIEQLELSLD